MAVKAAVQRRIVKSMLMTLNQTVISPGWPSAGPSMGMSSLPLPLLRERWLLWSIRLGSRLLSWADSGTASGLEAREGAPKTDAWSMSGGSGGRCTNKEAPMTVAWGRRSTSGAEMGGRAACERASTAAAWSREASGKRPSVSASSVSLNSSSSRTPTAKPWESWRSRKEVTKSCMLTRVPPPSGMRTCSDSATLVWPAARMVSISCWNRGRSAASRSSSKL
mmetsp:Transcript_40662/g.112940  ORF Transcript_40662/g.112940 Transcript_40662/m.112940 type:complete len:222 (-) Transcript_40662:1136-1801(-)